MVKQRAVQRLKVADFASGIKANSLYAAFASFHERGDRSYWLLVTSSEAKQAKGPINQSGRRQHNQNRPVGGGGAVVQLYLRCPGTQEL